jgi:hypothetical protein
MTVDLDNSNANSVMYLITENSITSNSYHSRPELYVTDIHINTCYDQALQADAYLYADSLNI